MRIVVTGGRFYDDYVFLDKVLTKLHTEGYADPNSDLFIPPPIHVLANGACRQGGADLLSDYWADAHHVTLLHYPAEAHLGPRGNGIRHSRMLLDVRPHLVVPFPGGNGTKDCCSQAQNLVIPILHNVEDWLLHAPTRAPNIHT